jgi:heme a synthase
MSVDAVNHSIRSRRGRKRFSVATLITATALLAWGAFVTSINAGLAVPDWPTSFNSLDPFNPWPDWWTITPVLAEHGHRLLGALVGLMTLGLAIWTVKADNRKWMRVLGLAILILVSFQGLLGGLRVIWISMNLAIIHAAVAQLYFSLLAAMILFVSETWQRSTQALSPVADSRLRRLTLSSAIMVYVQILLGALLRHPGTGIDPILAALHIGFAFIAAGFVLQSRLFIRFQLPEEKDLVQLSGWTVRILALQVLLGLFAYFILLDEKGMVLPGNVQVLVNSAHLVIGAFLLAATVVTAILAWNRCKPH